MTATRTMHSTTQGPRLRLAFELSWNQWKLAFTVGHGQPARLRSLAAPGAGAVPVGTGSSRTGDQQGGEQCAAADDGGAGLGLAALAAQQ